MRVGYMRVVYMRVGVGIRVCYDYSETRPSHAQVLEGVYGLEVDYERGLGP